MILCLPILSYILYQSTCRPMSACLQAHSYVLVPLTIICAYLHGSLLRMPISGMYACLCRSLNLCMLFVSLSSAFVWLLHLLASRSKIQFTFSPAACLIIIIIIPEFRSSLRLGSSKRENRRKNLHKIRDSINKVTNRSGNWILAVALVFIPKFIVSSSDMKEFYSRSLCMRK